MQKGSGCVCFTRDLKTAFRRMPTERIFYGLFTGSLFVAIKQGLAWLKQKRRADRKCRLALITCSAAIGQNKGN